MTNDQGTNAAGKIKTRFGAGQMSGGIMLLVCMALLTGCSKREDQNAPAAQASDPSPAPTKSGRQIFDVRGVIREIKPAESEVVIMHEQITNYMEAMTMAFEVKDTNELSGLATNDQVTFRMIVTETEGWIDSIKKIGVDTNSVGAPTRPSTRLVREAEPLEVGNKMPDYSFTNSLGEKMSLSDLKGQAYAFTFIFTRCPFPNFCPRMNMNFAAAYEQLSKMENGPTNWHLISISFDPDFDTPQRLAAYSATYKPDPKKWSWVTGAMIDIDAITEQVGLIFAPEKGTINHNLRTVVVDKNGVIRKMFMGNEWKTEDLVKEIVGGAGVGKE